jgi:hypothetical protein
MKLTNRQIAEKAIFLLQNPEPKNTIFFISPQRAFHPFGREPPESSTNGSTP